MAVHPSQEPSPEKTDLTRYLQLVDRLSAENAELLPAASVAEERTLLPADPYNYHTVATAPSVDINDEIAREQKLKNDNIEQDIRLKRETLNRLFIFLAIETGLIFLFAFWQAIHWPARFHLEDWSFRLLVTATILQITGMLYVAVRYLFPKGK